MAVFDILRNHLTPWNHNLANLSFVSTEQSSCLQVKSVVWVHNLFPSTSQRLLFIDPELWDILTG